MYSLAKTYDERELSPVFEDPLPVIRAVLREEPPAALLSRLEDRRGMRSRTEQPEEDVRLAALARGF
jgi:hypothetical protein